jgi:hypothetical protein
LEIPGPGGRASFCREVPGGGVGHAAEVSVEGAVAEKGGAEISRDGEDELAVGGQGKHLLDHPLGPQQGALLATARTQPADLAGGGDQALRLLGAIGIDASQAQKSEMEIPAPKEPLQEPPHPGGQGAVFLLEAVVPHPGEFLQGVLDDLLELVGRRAGAVERRCGRRELGHEET